MKICAVTHESVNSIWQNYLDKIGYPDLLIFGYNGLGLVSYKKELSLQTEYFQDIANLSKQTSSVVISGCDTDTYGVFRHSAVIADKGKLIGVSDMLYSVDDSEYSAGSNLRVYQTSCGRIGIVIREDLYFNDIISTLTLCDADIIVCIFNKVENSITNTVLKSQSFCNGIDIVLVAKDYFAYSNTNGNIDFYSKNNIINKKIDIEKEYHLLNFKKRCLKKD